MKLLDLRGERGEDERTPLMAPAQADWLGRNSQDYVEAVRPSVGVGAARGVPGSRLVEVDVGRDPFLTGSRAAV